MPRYGAYSKDIVLARPDGRTREGRCLIEARRSLIEHFGGEENLTITQRALIEPLAGRQARPSPQSRPAVSLDDLVRHIRPLSRRGRPRLNGARRSGHAAVHEKVLC